MKYPSRFPCTLLPNQGAFHAGLNLIRNLFALICRCALATALAGALRGCILYLFMFFLRGNAPTGVRCAINLTFLHIHYKLICIRMKAGEYPVAVWFAQRRCADAWDWELKTNTNLRFPISSFLVTWPVTPVIGKKKFSFYYVCVYQEKFTSSRTSDWFRGILFY